MMSVIAYLKFGFNSLIFNYIFSLYVILIIINFGKEINKADWLKIMKTVAIIMATLVIARFIKYHKEIFTFCELV